MNTPTDDLGIEAMRARLDRPLAAAAEELQRSRRLPAARYVTSGVNGTVVLEAVGDHPLDAVLAWAGEMVPAPHWWTLRVGTWPALELYASGSIGGLVVSIRVQLAHDLGLPTYPTTDDVLVAAAHARWPR